MQKSKMRPNPAARKVVGRIIKEVTDRSGLSIDEIAKRVQVSRQYVYRSREGFRNVSVDLIGNIFDACGTSLEEWITRQSRYGIDRQIHMDVQTVLAYGGKHATTLRTTLQGCLALIAKESKEHPSE